MCAVGLFVSFGATFAAQDIMDVMFQPTKDQQKLIDLWTTKQQIWDAVFRSSTQVGLSLGGNCIYGDQKKSANEISKDMVTVGYSGDVGSYCTNILKGTIEKINVSTQQQAPLLVRITKFLLRMTIVLSITMILYNGVLWIVESSSGNDVKDAKNNLIYIFVGILLALSSVALINLVSSLGVSSLDPSSVVSSSSVSQ